METIKKSPGEKGGNELISNDMEVIKLGEQYGP